MATFDQVGRVVHDLRGPVHGQDGCMARLSAPCLDLKMRADLLVVRYIVRGVTSSAVSDGSRRLDRTWTRAADPLDHDR